MLGKQHPYEGLGKGRHNYRNSGGKKHRNTCSCAVIKSMTHKTNQAYKSSCLEKLTFQGRKQRTKVTKKN